jgi:hypothetical protein
MQERAIVVDSAVLGASAQITLRFHLDHPARPVDLGVSADSRALGMGLLGMRLDPVVEPDPGA